MEEFRQFYQKPYGSFQPGRGTGTKLYGKLSRLAPFALAALLSLRQLLPRVVALLSHSGAIRRTKPNSRTRRARKKRKQRQTKRNRRSRKTKRWRRIR